MVNEDKPCAMAVDCAVATFLHLQPYCCHSSTAQLTLLVSPLILTHAVCQSEVQSMLLEEEWSPRQVESQLGSIEAQGNTTLALCEQQKSPMGRMGTRAKYMSAEELTIRGTK